MAKYSTNTEELTSIADAIRAKSGTNLSLTYPAGFVSAIQNIPTGSNNSYNLLKKDASGDTSSSSIITNDISLGIADVTPGYNQQIITPETGYSGFHTVNIGAMPPYSLFGSECLYTSIVAEDTISLDNTNFANITPTTSSQTILTYSDLPDVYRDLSQRIGVLEFESHVKYVFKENTTINARYPLWFSTYQFQCYGARSSSPGAFLTDEYNYVSENGGTSGFYILVYRGSNGHDQITQSNIGIRPSLPSPSINNRNTPSNVKFTFRTINITIVASNSYAIDSAFSNIDTTNTLIYYKTTYKEYPFGNNFYHNAMDKIKNYYKASGLTPV